MNELNISEFTWKIFQSELYHTDQYKSKSNEELLDFRLYDERLVILMLYTVPSVPSGRTAVNTLIEFLGKKS